MAGCGIKLIGAIFKIKILIYQLKANVDVKILFGKITNDLDLGTCKMLSMVFVGNENRPFSDSEKESQSDDTLLDFVEVSNVHDSDRSSSASRWNLASYQNV